MSYLNSVTIVGFVGADPEQRQARNNGSKFTVLSVATQRSWKKNAEDEWVSKVEWHRVAIFRPRLAEAVLNNIKKGAHVLVGRRMAKARKPRPRRSLRGRFAPMSCAGSTAANLSQIHRTPLWVLRDRLPNHPAKFRTKCRIGSGPPANAGGPFFVRPELRPEKEKLTAARCFPVYGRPGFALSFFKAQGLPKLPASSPLLAARHVTQET